MGLKTKFVEEETYKLMETLNRLGFNFILAMAYGSSWEDYAVMHVDYSVLVDEEDEDGN